MKKFSMKHRLFPDTYVEVFDEDSAPEWLVSPEYKWWWTKFVLTLNVNESKKTDFRTITRVK